MSIDQLYTSEDSAAILGRVRQLITAVNNLVSEGNGGGGGGGSNNPDAPLYIDPITGIAAFKFRPTLAGNTPYDTGNFDPTIFAVREGAVIENGDNNPNSLLPALTVINSADPVTGQLRFFPALPAAAQNINQIIKAGDAALIVGGDSFSQGFVIANDQVGTGRPQGIRISSSGVEVLTFAAHGVATFDGRPIFNAVADAPGDTPWDSGNLDPSQFATKTMVSQTYLTQDEAAATYATIAESDTHLKISDAATTYVRQSGGVVSANLTFEATGSVFKGMTLTTGGKTRWNVGTDIADTGSGNGGGDLRFYRYDDNGLFLGSVISISRSTGIAAFTSSPTVPTPAAGDNTTKAASTAFVAAAVTAAGGSTSTGIIAKDDLLAQTGAVTQRSIVASTAKAGMYKISMVAVIKSLGNTGSMTLAASANHAVLQNSDASVADTQGEQISWVFNAYSDAGAPIVVSTLFSFTGGGTVWPTYDLHTRVEFIG
jgi:hypothetical protein